MSQRLPPKAYVRCETCGGSGGVHPLEACDKRGVEGPSREGSDRPIPAYGGGVDQLVLPLRFVLPLQPFQI